MLGNLLISTLFMFISPAITLWNGLKSTSFVFKRWLITIFITFYGSIIFIPENADGGRHWQNVYDHYMDMSVGQFFDAFYHILIFDPLPFTNDDVYIHVLSFFVGGILNAPFLFFVIVAFIYGYFFSGAVLKILKGVNKDSINFWLVAFIAIFLMWKNIEGINTVRTWTGLWVLMYGVISYYETKKIKYLLLIFTPPLIHIGFLALAVPAWIVVFFGNRKWIYTALFLLSFGVNFFNPGQVAKRVEESSELGASKGRAYYIGDNVTDLTTANKSSNFIWYKKMHNERFQDYGIHLIALLLIFSGIYFYKMNPLESSLFSIGILATTLSNNAWFFYAVANRSAEIAGLFILATLVLVLKRQLIDKRVYWTKGMLVGIIVLMLPFIVYFLSNTIQFLSVFIIAFPFVPWAYYELNISIREAIGLLL